jgi:DNA-binding transcriptional regulator YiaG
MPNLLGLLNDEIRRLARREVRALTRKTRRLTAQHRRDLAAIKRLVAALARTVAFLEKQVKRRVAGPPAPREIKGVRFSARSARAQRARLGLSAKNFGKLVGVTALTIYSWESGKSRPRAQQVASLASVRHLGKREARTRLEMLAGQ